MTGVTTGCGAWLTAKVDSGVLEPGGASRLVSIRLVRSCALRGAESNGTPGNR